jgi:hypothetical protein
MMKRKIIILLALISIAVAIFLLTTKEKMNHPKRPANVPTTTIWKGSLDEGFWIEFVSENKDSSCVRLRIYNDYNGNMVYDANFSMKSNLCNIKDKTILDSISYFEFDKIVLKNGATLEIKPPVYGGEWREK